MAVIIVNQPDGRKMQPSDNQLIFQLASSLGSLINVDPDATFENTMEFGLSAITGTINNGVFAILPSADISGAITPISEINSTAKLPTVVGGLNEINSLYEDLGVEPPIIPNQQYSKSYFYPSGMTLTTSSSGGGTAKIEGRLINSDDLNNYFDVEINFYGPYDWSLWSAFGYGYLEPTWPDERIVMPEPNNVFEFLPGTAPTQTGFENNIGANFVCSDFESDGTIVTFSGRQSYVPSKSFKLCGINTGTGTDIPSPAFAYNDTLKSVRTSTIGFNWSSTPSPFEGCDNLEYLHFTSPFSSFKFGASNYTSFMLNNLPSLKTLIATQAYDSGNATNQNLVGPGCTALTDVYFFYSNRVLNDGSYSPDIPSNYLIHVPLSAKIHCHIYNATSNAGGPQTALANWIGSGGTVVYYDNVPLPQMPTAIGTNNQTYYYYLLNETNSTITGGAGSTWEGTSVQIVDANTTVFNGYPGLQVGVDIFTFGNTANTLTAKSMFMLSGTNEGNQFMDETKYSFLAKLYVNGVYHSEYPIATIPGKEVKIDMSVITRSLVDKLLLPTLPVQPSYNQAIVSVQVYELINGIEVGEPFESDVVDIFKGRLSDNDFVNWNYNVHMPVFSDSEGVSKFLTTYPRSEKRYIKSNDNFYIGALYNPNLNTLIDTLELDYELYIGDSYAGGGINYMYELSGETNWTYGIHTAINLKQTLWEFDQETIDQATKYRLFFAYIQEFSEVLEFEVIDDCGDNGKSVHFMNKLGAMETYYFPVRERNMATSKSFNMVNDSFNYDPAEVGEVNFLKRIEDTIELRSKYLPEAVYNWLVRELFESPFIIIDFEDGTSRRVKILDNSYEYKTHRKNKIFDLVVKFQISEIRYSPLI
jgi:hypothetical protein